MELTWKTYQVNCVRRFDPKVNYVGFVNVELYSNRETLNEISFFLCQHDTI